MSASAITTRARIGLQAPSVTVETHLPGGLPGFTLVGMPETAVREARDRVKSAIQTCGFEFPRGRVIVNLAPAELAKEGSRYDLAIATSILCATGQLPYRRARDYEYFGELSLFGELRPTRGALCAALAATRGVILAPADAVEALAVGVTAALPLEHLSELKQLLLDPAAFSERAANSEGAVAAQAEVQSAGAGAGAKRWHRIVGQPSAKRALLIAAAGGHHLLLVGPPGAGKSLLASCLIELLPPLTEAERREVAAVYSASGYPPGARQRPFRAPHHSASAVAMVGGGRQASAGEISLAHRGVLFLDELPHFAPSVLDLLREPLSNGCIELARANYRVEYPARFQLIAAMNPCPSGFTCSARRCRCTSARVRAYQGRVSGPLLDRIDLQIEVPPVSSAALLNTDQPAPTSNKLPAQVAAVREQQLKRQGCLNCDTDAAATLRTLPPATVELVRELAGRNALSARSQHRLINVARTIADLAAAVDVGPEHVGEAFALRQLDWEGGLGTQT